jgi:hypothetical protein
MRYWLLTLVLLISACTPTVVQLPAPTLAPSAAPSPSVELTPIPSPTNEPIDLIPPVDLTPASSLAPYRAAMRSDFVNDLDQFAAATQYQIDLTIAPDLASYTATQRVRYVNNETTPLAVVYFRLFPNTSSYGGELTVNTLKVNDVDVKPIEELGKSALRISIEPPLPIGTVVDLNSTT